eukprot:2104180-Amphidinium_carterae.2
MAPMPGLHDLATEGKVGVLADCPGPRFIECYRCLAFQSFGLYTQERRSMDEIHLCMSVSVYLLAEPDP